jgi:hypothetical protein
VKFGVVDPTEVVYKMRMMGGPALDNRLGWHQFAPDEGHPQRACVVLPVGFKRPSDLVPADAPDDHPLRYGVLRIYVHQAFTFLPASRRSICTSTIAGASVASPSWASSTERRACLQTTESVLASSSVEQLSPRDRGGYLHSYRVP